MKPYDHQLELANKGLKILKENMIVYFACEERTGKTLASILVAERLKQINKVLVLTKKKALTGWTETIFKYKPKKHYQIINYHQASKIKVDYDLVILDEAHNYISSFPKRSKMWADIRKLTKGKPLIYMSATPFAQGYQLLYHQFKLSDWSPWLAWENAYEWFGSFGIPKSIWIAGKEVQQYNNIEQVAFDEVKHLFITMKRSEIGFKVEPDSKIHYVELEDKTKQVYNTLIKDRAIELNGWTLICDTVSKLRPTLHMLEGGVALVLTKPEKGRKKLKRNYIQLGNTEKIQYILYNFGDSKDVVIMYNYIAEEIKLKKYFKHATILQATSFAEGVDLSGYKHLIVYSQDFSTARHTQRKARQANLLRTEPIIVHYLLVSGAISDQAYKAVAINKMNYVDRLYDGSLLT